MGMEYVHIRNRMYKTLNSWEWWVHRNRPLGYYLGSDLDNLQLDASHWIRPNWWLKLQYNHLRRGEGRMSKPYDMPWMDCTVEQGYHEKFPTGVVEETGRIELQLMYHPHVACRVTAELVYQEMKNVNNVAGQKDSEWSFRLGVWWSWNKILQMDKIGRE